MRKLSERTLVDLRYAIAHYTGKFGKKELSSAGGRIAVNENV